MNVRSYDDIIYMSYIHRTIATASNFVLYCILPMLNDCCMNVVCQ